MAYIIEIKASLLNLYKQKPQLPISRWSTISKLLMSIYALELFERDELFVQYGGFCRRLSRKDGYCKNYKLQKWFVSTQQKTCLVSFKSNNVNFPCFVASTSFLHPLTFSLFTKIAALTIDIGTYIIYT